MIDLNMPLKQNVLIWSTVMVIILYILQGVILGFISSIPFYLTSYKASWQQQGTFSWVSYPFSLKILWAPIIDSVYSRRFGRNQTWLIPIQLIVGILLLILSFYLESLLINLKVIRLTIIFLLICWLIASQDIVVDGWSVSLFVLLNPQWASSCQTIGVTIGGFIGSTILMTFESSNFTNKYIREPLSLPHHSYGLFSLEQFTLFFGLVFIIISIIMAVVSIFTTESNNIIIQKKRQTKLNLFETYSAILDLFKKRCIRQLALILITCHVGYGATHFMTNLILLEYGITRDTLALLRLPLLVIHILIPLSLNGTQRPLIWFSRGYILRLIGSLILAFYIFFTPRIIHTSYFYPVLIILLCLHESFIYLKIASCIGFYARISEPRIAGTYMTLLATISNLGHNLSSTLALYIANWLPKAYAYSIEVVACSILGFIWIGLAWNTLRRLDGLPVEEWHLKHSPSIHYHLIAEEESEL